MCRFRLLLVVGSVLWLAACGSSNNGSAVTGVATTCYPSPIQSSQLIQCSALVTGTGAFVSTVTWSASAGSITTNGTFTAPFLVGKRGFHHHQRDLHGSGCHRTYVRNHNRDLNPEHRGNGNSDGGHQSSELAAAYGGRRAAATDVHRRERSFHHRNGLRSQHQHLPDNRSRAGGHRFLRAALAVVGADHPASPAK